MKLILLNTWGGCAGKGKLLAFLNKYKDVDIFCLQEIWSAPHEHFRESTAGGLILNHDNVMVYGMQEISERLNGYISYF